MERKRMDIKNIVPWAVLNSIQLNGVAIENVGSAGIGIKLTTAKHNAEDPIITIPQDMILSQEGVFLQAKSDAQLRELLLANEAFSQRARGAIILFLTLQLSRTAEPASAQGVGRGTSPWIEYVRFLSPVPLPTCWNEQEIDSLKGTSLLDATAAKLKSLSREFEQFKVATKDLVWCQKAWWDEENVTLQDWVLVDAWYRSRVLEIPHLGLCMVPVLDFCNHATNTNARFEVNDNGDVILLLTEDLKDGGEVFINYGKGKSAAEMAFSYGFIEDNRIEALQISLNLINTSTGDDVYTAAKQQLLASAPVLQIKLTTLNKAADCIGRLLGVNQEDGFNIRVLQENDGTKHLQAFWFDDVLQINELQDILRKTEHWPLFKLRSTFLVKQRVEEQLLMLESINDIEPPKHTGINDAWHIIRTIRKLEKSLLGQAKSALEVEETELYDLPVVQEYLGMMGQPKTLKSESDEESDEDLT